MNVECDHCGTFYAPGQNSDVNQGGCPNCARPYRDQPSPTQSDMTLRDMPDPGNSNDTGGNPLQEGMLGGWKNRTVRDESFASVRKASPEFQTTELVLPQDLFRHAMKTEAAHRANVQIPHGITDNLHATLGNLQAWVQNPYENGDLRPYYNKYWKVIRPSFTKPGSVQIGVADPTMAEIINHVAQTDDITPLYEYRGQNQDIHEAMVKMSPGAVTPEMAQNQEAGAAGRPLPYQDSWQNALTQDLLPLVAPLGLAGAGAGAAGAGADAAGSAAAAGGADAAGAAAGAGAGAVGESAANAAGESAGGVGGVMKNVLKGMTPAALGAGAAREIGMKGLGLGLNSVDDVLGMGGGGAGGGGGGGAPINPPSFYARTGSDEDDAFPNVHGEIPKQDDGDYHQQDDGNNHEWQRDISVDDQGGGASHAPSFQHGGPALEQFMTMLPLLKQMLDSGTDGSNDPLVKGLHEALEAEVPGYMDHADDNAVNEMVIRLLPGGNDADNEDQGHTHENAGGKHEASVPSTSIRRPRFAQLSGEGSDFLPDLTVTLPYLDHKLADNTQGPTTPEQIQAVQQFLIDNSKQLHLEGQELTQSVLNVPTNPLQYADILAEVQQREPPPAPSSSGLSGNPPPPAQEEAPPEDTMPVPGMSTGQQMQSAVERYSADSVANQCPRCKSHTTELLDDEGNSRCHACKTMFKTKDKTPVKMTAPTASWHVDQDFSKKAAGDTNDFGGGPPQGVPAADQVHQRDHRNEEDSGHTWTDEDGNPLMVGQQYEMYSQKYDIPDLIRVEAVKPNSIVYELTGEYGLQHSTELTREEANIEGTSFSLADDGGMGTDDGSLENNNDDNTGYTGSPEHTDISAPKGLVSASVHENPNLAWLKTGGANFTPMEQRALIEESGEARNADRLDLLGTHYVQDADEDQFLFGL